MTVGKRISWGYGGVMLLLATVMVIGINNLRDVVKAYDRFLDVNSALVLGATQLELEARDQTAQYRGMLLNPSEQRRFLDDLRESHRQFDALVERMRNLERSEATRSILEQIVLIQAKHEAGQERVIALAQQGKRTEALESSNKEVLPLAIQLRERCEQYIERQRAFLAEGRAGVSTAVSRASILMVSVSLFALVVGLTLAFLVTRAITRKLREGVAQISSATAEILATTTQVASGAAETATSVNETTATVEEAKQTAHASAQKAKYVLDSAQKSAQVSQKGKASVTQTVEGMNRIREQMEDVAESIARLSEQSQAIGEIIGTVNDLADQSNLLAVNAAIEAAKAGEHGKGFAVVAQEVKSLAEQSKQATTQVRGILSDVQKATNAAVLATEQGTKAVESGVKLSADSSESIQILAESIGEFSQVATQIVASVQQQLAGMDQIALAMGNIKQATEQNLGGTKQAEQAAQGLNSLAELLRSMIQSDQTRVQS